MRGVPRALPRWEFFDLLLFFYFLTLHADQLSVTFGSYTLRWNNLLAGFLLLALFLRYRRDCFTFDKRLALALGAIFCSMLLSFIFSPYKKRCFFFLGFYGMTVFYYIFLPYLIIMKRDEKKILWLYFASFLAVGLYAGLQLLLSFFGIKDPFLTQSMKKLWRPNALSYEPSFYALYMTPFITIVNGYYLLNKEKVIQTWQLLLINFLFLLSTSTTTIFAYFTLILFFLSLTLSKNIRTVYPHLLKRCLKFSTFFGLMIGIFSLLMWQVMKTYFLKFFYFGFMTHYSFFLRWKMIVNAFLIFLKRPLLGVGMGGIPAYLYDAWTKRDKSFYYYKTLPYDNLIKCFEPSNVFTEILASLGLIGIAAFTGLIWVYILKARKLFFTLSHENKLIVILFLSSFLISTLILQINQGVFRTYIWTHLSLTYAWMVKREKTESQLQMAKSH